MIDKRIRPSYTFRDMHATAHLVGSFSKGLDRGILQKVASAASILDMARDIKPEKGFGYVHLVTTGSGETYGANNNGDYFNKTAKQVNIPNPKAGTPSTRRLEGGLLKYHDTFCKYASVYREHNNSKKGGSPLGDVVMQAYNAPMERGELIVKLPEQEWHRELQKLASDDGNVFFSMGAGVPYDICFTKGTPIDTDKGLKNIEDIEEGDTVLTHTGTWRQVLKPMKNIHSGELLRIVSSGDIADESYVTPNHPYFAVRQELMAVCHGSVSGAKRKCVPGEDNTICSLCSKPLALPSWVEASELRLGDYLTYPVPCANIQGVSDDQAYLLGMYAGNGHLIKQRGGRNKDTGPVKDMGVVFTLDKSHPTIIDRVASAVYAVTGKECRLYDDKGATRVSIYDQSLAALCRKYCSEYSADKTLRGVLTSGAAKSFIGGLLDSDGHVDIPKLYGRITVTSSKLTHALSRQAASIGYGLAVDVQPYSNDSYGSSGKIFVTCLSRDILQELSSYSVKAGYIHTWPTRAVSAKTRQIGGYICTPIVFMESVEATDEVVYNMSVEGDESYIANGVAVHNCSICGNEAKLTSDYCDHIKYNKLQIDKEGNQVFLYNDQPHFHDISCVGTPADRIAFGLSKVASENEHVFAIDEELNKGLYIPHSLIEKLAGKIIGERSRTLEKLADIEKRIALEPSSDDIKVLSDSFSGELDSETTKKLTDYPLEDVIGCCNKKDVMLPPKSFVKIVLGNPEGPIDGLEDMEEALPNVFQKLKADGIEALQDGSYTSGDSSRHWSGLDELIGKLTGEHSLADEPTNTRVVKTIVVGKPREKEAREIPRTAPSLSGEYLAKEYAKYQLSFLNGRDKYAKLVAVHNANSLYN